MCALESY